MARVHNVLKENKKLFPKSRIQVEDNEQVMKTAEEWISYYRTNPHLYANEVLELGLKEFQQIILCSMFYNDYNLYIAARGQGKTLVLGAAVATFSILFPGIKIAICSRTLDQSRETFNKIREFMNDSPKLVNEIREFGTAKNVRTITFKNGSKATIYPVSDNARGGRANITIVDEFFFTDKDKYTEVIVPFQSGKRTPKFTKKPQWANMEMVEDNKTIYTSSSVMEMHWGYEEYKKFCMKMLNGESYSVFALPVQINVLNGFKKLSELKEMRSNYTKYKWETEMMATFPGTSDNSFFEYDRMMCARKAKAIYPRYYYSLLSPKSKLKFIEKEKDEIRLLTCDIALMGGRQNDKSVYTVIRLIPTSKGYKRQVCYMESHSGMLSQKQAMRINRLFYEMDCDYIVIDGQSVGQSILDMLMDYLTDDTTGEEYPPLDCINNEEVSSRCVISGARKVIYSIKARPDDNDRYYTLLKTNFESGVIELLSTLETGELILSNNEDFLNLNDENQAIFRTPYEEVTDFIDEAIGLEIDAETVKKGKIKLVEKSGARKDHVSSIAYGNFIAGELERDYIKKLNTKKSSFLDMFMMPSQNDDWVESSYAM